MGCRQKNLRRPSVVQKESQNVARDPAQMRAEATIVKTVATVIKIEVGEMMTIIVTAAVVRKIVGAVTETAGAVIGIAAEMIAHVVKVTMTTIAKGKSAVIGHLDALIAANHVIVTRHPNQILVDKNPAEK